MLRPAFDCRINRVLEPSPCPPVLLPVRARVYGAEKPSPKLLHPDTDKGDTRKMVRLNAAKTDALKLIGMKVEAAAAA